MDDFEKLFEDLVNEFQSDKIIIKETPLDEIQKIRPGFIDGCLFPFVLNNEYHHFQILIDEKLDYEKKICIILHEMGHINLNSKLGFEEVDKRIKDNRPKWTQLTEFQAFKYQLAEGKRLFEKGHTTILNRLINSINEIHASPDIDPSYKLAIEDIFKESIWKQCNNLIGTH